MDQVEYLLIKWQLDALRAALGHEQQNIIYIHRKIL